MSFYLLFLQINTNNLDTPLMCQKVDILLVTPPFVQWNCPYPASPVLTGFLKKKKYSVSQVDLSIELIIRLFSKSSLIQLFDENLKDSKYSKKIYSIFNNRQKYIDTIDFVIRFLQTNDQTMAYRIVSDSFLPDTNQKMTDDDIDWAFGTIGITEKARYMATLYIEDLGEYISELFSPSFGFNRYAESIRHSAHHFEELEKAINTHEKILDDQFFKLLNENLEKFSPKIIGFSIPFPGNLLSTLKACKYLKSKYPDIKLVWGGGYVNTELRTIKTTEVFKYVDFISLDDGEMPLIQILEHVLNDLPKEKLVRTYCLEDKQVKYYDGTNDQSVLFSELPAPDYTGLPINKYISVIEVTNPMHKLWSDGFWNKLVLAHGCYWHKCTFCDTSLDYIARYEPDTAINIVDKIERIIAQTGKYGFHFTDEAAPPKLLREISEELIKRKLQISWWTNIRFEKAFNNELCLLMAQSGCIAVSGGLEVASDRILKLINKGVTIEQARDVATNMTNNGIMVHAYLMYGFPTQTALETIDSLEVVRDFFEKGLLQSAFWHRFTMTAHSPIGCNPKNFGVKALENKEFDFANNDIEHIDNTGCDHDKYAEGLRIALYNYMHGVGFDIAVKKWFKLK